MATIAHRIDYFNKKFETKRGLLHDILHEAQPTNISRLIFVHPRDHYAKCGDCQQVLHQDWAWPTYFFGKSCHDSNGFVHETILDQGTPDERTIKHLRCLVKQVFYPDTKDIKDEPFEITYEWYEMTITIKQLSNGATSLICFGVPQEFHKTFEEALLTTNTDRNWHTDGERVVSALMQELVRLYDESVWAISKLVRKIEKARHRMDVDFAMMHELMRHTIHTTEVLEVTGDSLKELNTSRRRGTAVHTATTSSDKLHIHYDFFRRLLDNFRRRSKANEMRLQNEINLALNLATQKDSRATIELSQAAQKDSAAMRLISVVTLVFLPATFVATIFGMSFFNFQQEDPGWAMSGQVWIFWVVAVALTVVTIIAYFLSQIWAKQQQKKLTRVSTIDFLKDY